MRYTTDTLGHYPSSFEAAHPRQSRDEPRVPRAVMAVNVVLSQIFLLPYLIVPFLLFFAEGPEPILFLVWLSFSALFTAAVVRAYRRAGRSHTNLLPYFVVLPEYLAAAMALLVLESSELLLWPTGTGFAIGVFALIAAIYLVLLTPVTDDCCRRGVRRTLVTGFLLWAALCYVVPWERIADLPDRAFASNFSQIRPGMTTAEVDALLGAGRGKPLSHDPSGHMYFLPHGRYLVWYADSGVVSRTSYYSG